MPDTSSSAQAVGREKPASVGRCGAKDTPAILDALPALVPRPRVRVPASVVETIQVARPSLAPPRGPRPVTRTGSSVVAPLADLGPQGRTPHTAVPVVVGSGVARATRAPAFGTASPSRAPNTSRRERPVG